MSENVVQGDYERGYKAGYDKGLAAGKAEVQKLMDESVLIYGGMTVKAANTEAFALVPIEDTPTDSAMSNEPKIPAATADDLACNLESLYFYHRGQVEIPVTALQRVIRLAHHYKRE